VRPGSWMALPPRHAISRARLFLDLADQCPMAQRDRCEEPSWRLRSSSSCGSPSGASAVRRTTRVEGIVGLLNDPDLKFIREHRDWIVKEAPEKFKLLATFDTSKNRRTCLRKIAAGWAVCEGS
jgi:hypothetical protein